MRDAKHCGFTQLVELSGLDPARDLRFGDWSGVDFAGSNLDGYNFTGSALLGCKFEGARIKGAVFIQCEFGRAYNFRREGWRLTFDSTPVANIAAASDWKEAVDAAVRARTAVPRFCPHLRVGARFREDIFGPLMTVVPSGIVGEEWRRDGIALSDRFELSNEVVRRSKYGKREQSPERPSLCEQLGIPVDWRYAEIGGVHWARLIGLSDEEISTRFTSLPSRSDFNRVEPIPPMAPGFDEAARECGTRLLRFLTSKEEGSD